MNILPARVAIPQFDEQETIVLPLAIPDVAEVEALARELHAGRVAYEGVVWGWPVQYEPELREESAEFQIPDGQGGWRTEMRPFFSPASFTIGQNGFGFYSLLWENGREAPQWCMWKAGEREVTGKR